MNIDDIKYRKCDRCEKGYPLAHWVPNKRNSENHSPHRDRYKAHENTICRVCICEDADLEDKRLKKLRRMMGA